jgi:hypothetical protein
MTESYRNDSVTEILRKYFNDLTETIKSVDNQQACFYLDDCCALKLFNLPNGIVEQFGKTKAVNYLLNLKAKYTIQLTIK